MDITCFPDQVWIDSGPGLFRVVVGGDHVWQIILDHWSGVSWRDIEAKHGIPQTTARRWVTIAKQNMRQAGLNADAVRGYAEIAKAGV